MGHIAISHDRGDRAKGLNLMNGLGGIRIWTVEQHRRHKCPLFGIGPADHAVLRIAEYNIAFPRQKL